MKMIPLGDRVIVRLLEKEEKKKGGIIIPDTAKERPQRAKSSPSARVVAPTPASAWSPKSRRATACSSPSMPATKIEIESAKYLVMKEDEILAIL